MPHMTEEEFENIQSEDGTEAALDADSAVAVDPGVTTGVAIAYSDGLILTRTYDFWRFIDTCSHSKLKQLESPVYIVEAPYMTQWQKTKYASPRAYSSGRVAREAELLVEGIRRMGLPVVEHDPAHSGDWDGKWDSKLAHQIVGEWKGPDNSHTRDCLKLLTIYGFAG